MKDKKLLSDREFLKTIKDLMIIQCFTYNEDIIENIRLVIWELIIDQLTNKR